MQGLEPAQGMGRRASQFNQSLKMLMSGCGGGRLLLHAACTHLAGRRCQNHDSGSAQRPPQRGAGAGRPARAAYRSADDRARHVLPVVSLNQGPWFKTQLFLRRHHIAICAYRRQGASGPTRTLRGLGPLCWPQPCGEPFSAST